MDTKHLFTFNRCEILKGDFFKGNDLKPKCQHSLLELCWKWHSSGVFLLLLKYVFFKAWFICVAQVFKMVYCPEFIINKLYRIINFVPEIIFVTHFTKILFAFRRKGAREGQKWLLTCFDDYIFIESWNVLVWTGA